MLLLDETPPAGHATVKGVHVTGEAWDRVGHAIHARRRHLGLTLTELHDRTVALDMSAKREGVSADTIGRYERGQPIMRRDKMRLLCDALGWTSESIDLIIGGHQPRVLSRRGPSARAVDDRLAALERRLDDVADAVEDLIRRLGGGGPGHPGEPESP